MNKAFFDIAKSIKDVTVLTEKEFAIMEDEILYREMAKAKKEPLINIEAFKKEMTKIIGKR